MQKHFNSLGEEYILTSLHQSWTLICDIFKEGQKRVFLLPIEYWNEISEIMGFVRIFWKNNVQEAYLLKMSISGQIVPEILAQL